MPVAHDTNTIYNSIPGKLREKHTRITATRTRAMQCKQQWIKLYEPRYMDIDMNKSFHNREPRESHEIPGIYLK